jgi:predicted PurR-regulated permease PerM
MCCIPWLVGDRLRLHTVPAFIAIVGGLILFGPAGLLLGPIVVTVAVFALEFWRVRVRRRLARRRSILDRAVIAGEAANGGGLIGL